jgi:hypothetical protein
LGITGLATYPALHGQVNYLCLSRYGNPTLPPSGTMSHALPEHKSSQSLWRSTRNCCACIRSHTLAEHHPFSHSLSVPHQSNLPKKQDLHLPHHSMCCCSVCIRSMCGPWHLDSSSQHTTLPNPTSPIAVLIRLSSLHMCDPYLHFLQLGSMSSCQPL